MRQKGNKKHKEKEELEKVQDKFELGFYREKLSKRITTLGTCIYFATAAGRIKYITYLSNKEK